ncbi:Trigger factor, ribosome-binding, bacterial [Cynara cardunculus var. scolymus]|uniref:Trigger factor, ribosome-binding, bacterial n=1 Tax=Cynara cardunculus var. scolymus TaxID=59895 RepID=A0A103XIT5_CYNCS|nr:Trigger factor, ribosome-binding, bacterial [Cynara cardunculus var. scolymus]
MMTSMKITMNIPPTFFQFKHCNNLNPTAKSNHVHVPIWHTLATINPFCTKRSLDGRPLDSHNSHKSIVSFVRPLPAVEPGVEASISDENLVTVKNANILVELQDDDKMQVKVELSGKETQIVFDKVLTNLARTAPPVPGFRRQKGDRVTKFVIQEINNICVKDNKINTIQSAEELESSFNPGSDFGFNATIELEKPDTESLESSEA